MDVSVNCQKDDQNLQTGFLTKQTLAKLQREGDTGGKVAAKFFTAVRGFFSKSVSYMVSNFPFGNPVIENAVFTNFESREDTTLEQVHYFVERFSEALNFTIEDINCVEEQFNVYQLLENTDIPAEVIEDAKIFTTHRHGKNQSSEDGQSLGMFV